jgi:hypothetical protein
MGDIAISSSANQSILGVQETPAARANDTKAPTGALLPAPRPSVDVGEAIAKLVLENAFTQREAARKDRNQATNAMAVAQQHQLANMREEADDRYAAACASAVGKMVEGAASVVGGAVALEGACGRGAAKAEARGQIIGGSGKVFSAGSDLFAAGWTHAADTASANAKADEMAAKAAESRTNDASDEMKEGQDTIRTALDFLREFHSTQSKSMSSAIRA